MTRFRVQIKIDDDDDDASPVFARKVSPGLKPAVSVFVTWFSLDRDCVK